MNEREYIACARPKDGGRQTVTVSAASNTLARTKLENLGYTDITTITPDDMQTAITEQQAANDRAAYWSAHAKALILRKSNSAFAATLGDLFIVADSVNAHRLI